MMFADSPLQLQTPTVRVHQVPGAAFQESVEVKLHPASTAVLLALRIQRDV